MASTPKTEFGVWYSQSLRKLNYIIRFTMKSQKGHPLRIKQISLGLEIVPRTIGKPIEIHK